jgi:hypothetical protein
MIQSLRSSEIDVGIGLTEGWVAGLGKEKKDAGGYKLIGTYVESPLCWAISVGSSSPLKSIQQLRNGKMGVSRIGRYVNQGDRKGLADHQSVGRT